MSDDTTPPPDGPGTPNAPDAEVTEVTEAVEVTESVEVMAVSPAPDTSAGEAPVPPRSFGRRVARFALITGGVGLGVVGIVLVGVGSGLVWLTTDSGNAFIRDQVLTQAKPFIPEGKLDIDAVDTSLYGHLILRGVTLSNPTGKPMVEAEEVVLRYDLSHAFDTRVDITEVGLVRPQIDIEVLQDGNLDLAAAFGPSVPEPEPAVPEPPAPWIDIPADIRVKSLHIDDGTLRYRDASNPEAPMDVSVGGLALKAGAVVNQRHAELTNVRLDVATVDGLDLDLPLPLSVDTRLAYDESKLTVNQLDISARRTRIGITGDIDRVDFDDRVLNLDVDRIDLDEGDIEALAQDDVLLGSLSLKGTIQGSLADLTTRLQAETPGGSLGIEAWVDTTAQPLAWKASLDTASLDVEQITPLVPEPTHLNLELGVEGEGTDPATDLRGAFSLSARDQVVFNEVLPELRLGGRIDEGVVQIEEFGAVHSAATIAATGSVDLNNEIVQLETLNANVPSLAALGRYGAPGLRGSVGYSGRVRVEGFGEGGVVLAEGGLDLRGFAAQDAVAVQSLSGPVQARVELDTQAVQASGKTRVVGIEASGASVGSVDLGWTAKVNGGVVTAETSLDLAALSVGGGAVSIDRISTPEGKRFRAGVDRTGEPWAVGRLFMSEMGFGTAGYKADGGEIILGFRDPDGESGPESARLNVGFDLDRNGEASFFEGRVQGDLITGEWEIDDLVIAPTDDNPLVADGPVTFKLADGGARDIKAALRSEAGSLLARGSWVPDSEDGSNLELEVDKVDLSHVARMAQLFVAPEKEGEAKILEGLAGVASLSVSLKDKPNTDMVVDAVADLDSIVYPGMVEKLFLDAEVHGPITLPKLEARMADADERLLAALTGKVPLKVVEGAPQLDCSRVADIDAIVAPGNIQRFSATLPVAGELPEVQASAAVLVGGSACDPNLSLVASASVPVGVNGERVRLDIDVHREEGLVDIEGGVDIGLHRRVAIEGSATTNLTRVFEGAFGGGEMPPTDQLSTFASAIDVSVVPLGLPIQDLSAFAELPRGIQGRIAGGLNLSGEPSKPVVTGGLLWTEGALGEVLLDQAGFMLLPTEGGYTLDGDLAFSTGGSLMLDGFVPIEVDLDHGGEIDLERPGFEIALAGDGVPLQAVEGVVDGFSDAGGNLSLTGKVGGTVANPVPTFAIGIEAGTFALRDTRLLYSDIHLDAELSKNAFKLSRFDMLASTWGTQISGASVGPMAISGEVGLSDTFEPTDIAMKVMADSFWVADRKDLRLKISSGKKGIRVNGAFPDLKVRGLVAIEEGKLTLDESAFLPVSDLALDPLLVVHRKDQQFVQGKPQIPSEDDPVQRLDVALNIDMSKGFGLNVVMPMDSSMGSVGASLSTATVDLEVSSPGLKVGMKEGAPSLAGDVELGRGDLEFFSKSFDIGGGKLAFTGKNYTDPVLDLQATHHTGRYGDVGVAINGTATKFDIEFQSEDYPDQTDIISILLFGKPASELGDSEGQSGGSQLGAALQMAAGSSVNRALGSSLGGQVEFDQGAVKAGVPINDKLFLSVERNANAEIDENIFSVAIEYLISRQSYAELVTGDAGQSSADLYIRWRF